MKRATLLLVMVYAGAAEARATSDVWYTLGEAFSTAVRFVRVDRRCKILERDAEAAFVTFECHDDEHVKRGSLELWKTTVRGRDAVRLQVALGDDPHYMELRFLELLERKLREERGTPPPAEPPPAATSKKPEATDAGR